MTPLEKDVANAITHYNQTVQEDDNCNLCKAYLMYQNVLNSFKKMQEKFYRRIVFAFRVLIKFVIDVALNIVPILLMVDSLFMIRFT